MNKRQEQHIQGVIYGDYARQKNIWNFFISFFEKSSDENKRERRDRQNFMNFLRACYADVLKQSLQGTVLIELGLHTRPDALDPRAQLTFRHLNQVEQILPPDTSVVDVYDGAAGGLLILGEPGSGKSTLLVHLAQSLLIRAEQEELPEPPVILNLASWAQKRQPIEEWIVEELHQSYKVPHKHGKRWVRNEAFVPLLDGFDEVAESARTACVDALNHYMQRLLSPLVVCSRTNEYFEQQHRLALGSAVVIQPLTREQVSDFVAIDPSLVAVRTAIQENETLRKLATSPLWLNVLILTYRNASVESLPTSGSLEDQQQWIFDNYITRMLSAPERQWHIPKRRAIPASSLLKWLNWQAQQMRKHNQTTFYLEQLQPSWLSTTWQLHLYDWLVVRFPALFIGLLIGTIIISFFQSGALLPASVIGFSTPFSVLGYLLSRREMARYSTADGDIISNTSWQHPLLHLLRASLVGPACGLITGLIYGVVPGILIGLLVGLVYGLLYISLGKMSVMGTLSSIPPSTRKTRWRWLFCLPVYYGLAYGTLAGLAVGIVREWSFGIVFGIFVGVITTLIFGLVSGLIHLLLRIFNKVELFSQTLFSMRRIRLWIMKNKKVHHELGIGLIFGLIVGLVAGLVAGLLVGLIVALVIASRNRRVLHGLIIALIIGLIVGLVVGSVAGLLYGLLGGLLAGLLAGLALSRNTGVRYGLVIGSIFGLVIGLVVGLGIGLPAGLLIGLAHGLVIGLSNGLAFGLICGMAFGLSGGLLSVLLARQSTTIRPTDRLIWSWRRLGNGLFSKLRVMIVMRNISLVASLFGLGAFLLAQAKSFDYAIMYSKEVDSPPFGLNAILTTSLIFGLNYWLILGLFEGVSGEVIEDQDRRTLNEGIHRSARNGAFLGLASFLVVGLVIGSISWLSHGMLNIFPSHTVDNLNNWWIKALSLGLSIGLLVALLNGWLACLRHYILRFLLRCTGFIPWNYRWFLTEANRRILLYRVRGGYTFIHRLFQDHLADLNSAHLSMCICGYIYNPLKTPSCPKCGRRR